MNAAPLDPHNSAALPHPDEASWSAGRWIFYLALAFALHVGVFYLLADRKPIAPRPVKNAVVLRIGESLTVGQELADPTLFALPHPRGFAAATWLPVTETTFVPFRWTEPPRLLPLAVGQLGATFLQLAETNIPIRREMAALSAPATTVIPPLEIPPPRRHSVLRVNEALADRPLREPHLQLPLQRPHDGLSNTVVQVLVDARGQVISPTVVPPGSGVREVDLDALRIARGLWFKAGPEATPPVVGRLVFEWAVAPATNSPATKP